MLHPASAEALIDEEDFHHDERLPYWAELWPSSIALAQYLTKLDLSGMQILELGCGVGLPSVVALDRGAEVTATDHYTIALEFARQNAEINVGESLSVSHLDWHSDAGADLGKFDLVIAADVLYEQRNVPALSELIPVLLAPDGEALISDPRRKDTQHFRQLMRKKGFECSTQGEIVRQEEKDIEVLLHWFSRDS